MDKSAQLSNQHITKYALTREEVTYLRNLIEADLRYQDAARVLPINQASALLSDFEEILDRDCAI